MALTGSERNSRCKQKKRLEKRGNVLKSTVYTDDEINAMTMLSNQSGLSIDHIRDNIVSVTLRQLYSLLNIYHKKKSISVTDGDEISNTPVSFNVCDLFERRCLDIVATVDPALMDTAKTLTQTLISILKVKVPTFKGGLVVSVANWTPLMLELITVDKRNPDDAMEILKWIEQHGKGFHLNALLGPTAFRNKYDALQIDYRDWQKRSATKNLGDGGVNPINKKSKLTIALEEESVKMHAKYAAMREANEERLRAQGIETEPDEDAGRRSDDIGLPPDGYDIDAMRARLKRMSSLGSRGAWLLQHSSPLNAPSLIDVDDDAKMAS